MIKISDYSLILDSSKKGTLGQFSVHKIAPAFVFWKNPGQHIIFFREFLTFSKHFNGQIPSIENEYVYLLRYQPLIHL